MNSRRQTVWLVSMLGLMVVLSAYYLFTDEADQIPVPTEQTAGNEIIVEGVGMMDPTAAPEGASIDDIATLEEEPANVEEEIQGNGAIAGDEGDDAGAGDAGGEGNTGNADDEGSNGDAAVEPADPTLTNEQVLDQVSNMSAADAITAMQIERDSDFSSRIEELTAAMSDESATEQEITDAINKHSELMDLEAKLIAFEEKLLGDYENAAVTYDDDKEHYTVHVSAAQLERSEAVSIVTEAMNDLSIGIHQITVRLYK